MLFYTPTCLQADQVVLAECAEILIDMIVVLSVLSLSYDMNLGLHVNNYVIKFYMYLIIYIGHC